MKNKTMRKAMITSIVALTLCFAMLVGTTYAWFTDKAESTNNIIKSGKLDLVLEYTTDFTTWTEVTAATKLFDDNALFEPGYVEVAYVRVRNAGTLAFKYKLTANIASETLGVNQAGAQFKLSDSLKFGSAAVTAAYADRATAAAVATTTLSDAAAGAVANDVVLAAGATGDITALVIAMPTTVGNEANYGTTQPSITLGVTALATQATVENDSFDNQYDAAAEYPVADAAAATAALAAGSNVTLSSNITISGPQTISNQTLDGNGNTITVSNTGSDCGLNAQSGEIKNVAVTGTGRGIGTGSSGTYAMDGDLTVDNVTVDGPVYAMNIGRGNGHNVNVENSTILGWTSMDDVTATFTNCVLGGRTSGTPYAVFAIYDDVTFTDCQFSADYVFYGRAASTGTITLNNCTHGGTAVTAANFATLFNTPADTDFDYLMNQMTIIVDGVQVNP